MLVARPAADGSGGITYTKHYFAGTQRVSSKIGTTTNLGKFLEEWQQQEQSSPSYPAITTQAQMDKANTGATNVFGPKGFNFTNPPIITGGNTSLVAIPAFTHSTANEGKEIDQYYFHPDHLGSSNYITNFAGEVSQHSEYFAFGETFIEEHKNSHNSPYKFNGKELDEESGLYYYGARYYDPRISIWASVDPLAEKFPNFNPYNYVMQNPLNLIDPTGMAPEEGGNDPGKKGWFGKAVDTVKGWFSSDKPKSKGSVEVGPITAFVGVMSLETEATVVATETVKTVTAASGMSASSLGALALPLLCQGDTPKDKGQTYLYRNMKADGLFFPDPVLGQSANTLGIRPSDVGDRNFNENISPINNQGLSVTIGIGTYKSDTVTPQSVPNYDKKTVLWRLDPIRLIPLGLIIAPQPSPPGYGRILPLYDMSIQSFHERIHLTQSLWEVAPSNRK
jgi:RHS repeat-associated protein